MDSSAGSVRHAFNLGIGDDALDIDRVVIGGVADVGASLLMDALEQGLCRIQGRSPWVRALNLSDRIMLKPPEPVGVIGAAALTNRRPPE